MNAVAKVDQGRAPRRSSTPAPLAARRRRRRRLPQPAQAPRAAKQRRGRRLLLMAALPLAARRRRRLCLGDRRPLPGDRKRQSAPGQGVDRLGGRRPHRRGRRRRQRSRSRPATCCSRIDPEPYQHRAGAGRRRRLPPPGSTSSSCAPPTARPSRRSAWRRARSTISKSQFDRARPSSPARASTPSPRSTRRAHDLAKARGASSWRALQGIASARAATRRRSRHRRPTSIRPCLQRIAARDKAAWISRRRTVRAPADGIISQASSFKVGQYVAGRHAAVQPGRDRRHLGRGQLQGDPAHPHEARPGGRGRARHLSRRIRSRRRSTASAPAPARSSRCCRRRTPPATG